MLTFIGLGLYDEHSITVEGQQALRSADDVFAEFYTSRLIGTSVEDLASYHDVSITVRDRAGVEQEPAPILDAAQRGDAVFVAAGDTMISTTHVDLRLRAHERDIETRVIHAPTAETAASSLTGLQNYRFGKATTLPFPWAHGGDGVPESVVDTIEDNRDRGLHTLVYLDIKAEAGEYMRAGTGAKLLSEHWDGTPLGVVVARAGSPDPFVGADRLETLAEFDFGEPLHLLVIPGDLHHIEADALRELAGAPAEVLSE
ncbi:Diphthamide biosynthesis methyltransferase [Halanaeroarchaeum sp. HSR-CO]|uniref:diphthine synthase n=1 Tax=Halanaeroarchaeum sp. HSR-CO TaxID=2866382 RepID=UPI00217EEA1A|nr:diphthine synthase [Halanaeroarchaeum sp. HSR-CO]UWG47894.1 Diphthamide biosynthesis methyltransferase [Halanaeroarchaeum sp. HSR-CO]